MKKLTLLLLCAIMLSGFASCADSADNSVNSADTAAADTAASSDTETSSRYHDELPDDLDFDGYEFKVHSRYAPLYFAYTVSTSEENGEVVNDAMFRRDRALEERLNIKFTETTYDNVKDGQELPRSIIMSGDNTYDMFVGRDFQAFTWAAEGLLVNWDSLGYIDLSKPYWDRSINSSLLLKGERYFATGAFNLTSYEFTHTLLFNKTMHASLGLDDPYRAVLDGDWTLDSYRKMAKAAVADTNGDSVMDVNDRWGLISYGAQVLPSFWVGAEALSIKADENGTFIFTTPEDEKFIEVYTKILEVMWDDSIWYPMSKSVTDLNEQLKPFVDGHGLFCNANFFRISKFRDMDTDFGILPYPKWDESQDVYYGRIEGCEMPVIPVTNTEFERTGAILEALASESLDGVIAAYYDQAITGKYTRDEESAEMLDIITGNRIYDIGDTVLCSQLTDGIFRTAFEANDRDIVSALASAEAKVMSRLNLLNGEE
nr:hypothetical protein [Clostridia bacterium]